MTLGLSELKSNLNIIKINGNKESNKRKIDELMSSDNNCVNSFPNNNNIDTNNRAYYNSSYESPLKRARNSLEMTSNDINNINDKPIEKKGLFAAFERFKNKIFGSINDKSGQSVSKDEMSLASNSRVSPQEYRGLNSNDSNSSKDMNCANPSHSSTKSINHTDRVNFVNPYHQIQTTEPTDSGKQSLGKNNSSSKSKKRKHWQSYKWSERQKYMALLRCHTTREYNNSTSRLKPEIHAIKPPEIIDLTDNMSSVQTPAQTYGSISCNSNSMSAMTKEVFDGYSGQCLVDRIKSKGITAANTRISGSVSHKSSTPLPLKTLVNKPLYSAINDRLEKESKIKEIRSKSLLSSIPESCKIFQNSIKNSPLVGNRFSEDLRANLIESNRRHDKDVEEKERKYLELKAKRESDIEGFKDKVWVTYTRSELSYTPYCQLADKESEDESEEEESDGFKDLPALTAEMEQMIDEALRPTPPNQVLVEGFSLIITRKDMETLSGLNWLNDEVINFYMSLIVERGKNDNFSTSYAFNTFFYPKLKEGGHKALKRWTRRVDIFTNDFIFIPIHLGMHWCLAVIDFLNKSIEYYDSMGGKNHECVQALKGYLQEESLDKKQMAFDMSDWSIEIVKDIPQQMNGSDCGMFTCKYAEYISRKAKINFSQAHMPYFRRRMVYEILTKRLL